MTREEALNLFKDHEYWAEISLIDEACEIAIDAIKKQIPMKPKDRYTYDDNTIVEGVGRCPSCDSMVTQNLSTIKTDYCIRCGQAIDWSEEQEWSDTHPRKTYKDDFLETFPNAYKHPDGSPAICRNLTYGLKAIPCPYSGKSCTDCWNEIISETSESEEFNHKLEEYTNV